MKQLLRLFYNNQSNIYKALLFAFSTLFIVYLIPINNQFNYDFTKGDTWGYESLYAPFDFAIIKRQSEIEAEKLRLRKEAIVYFDADKSVIEKVDEAYAQNFKNYFPFREGSSRYKRYFNYGTDLLMLFTIEEFYLLITPIKVSKQRPLSREDQKLTYLFLP